MFLYNYISPNKKQFCNKKYSHCSKIESNHTENIKEPRKPNFQPNSPLYYQKKTTYTQTKKLTNSVETEAKKHNYIPKHNHQANSISSYFNHDTSLGKQAVSNITPNETMQGYQKSYENILDIDRNNHKTIQAEPMIFKYKNAMSQSVCNVRKAFSSNNSMEKAKGIDKTDSSLKREHNYNGDKCKNSTIGIEGYRNHPKSTLTISLSKEGDYLSKGNNNNTNSNVNQFSSQYSSTNQINSPLPSLSALNQLEDKFKLLINNPKYSSKNRRYNFIKSIFEELIHLYPIEHQAVMNDLLLAYHKVVLSFSIENKELREANASYQKRIAVNEKKHYEVLSLLKLKENEIESFKKKIEFNKNDSLVSSLITPISMKKTSEISKVQTINAEHKDINDEGENSHATNVIEVNPQMNNYIVGLNKKNLEDLEGLYFPDKVQTGSNLVSNQTIPSLQLNLNLIDRDELRQKRAKAIYANIIDMLEKDENQPQNYKY